MLLPLHNNLKRGNIATGGGGWTTTAPDVKPWLEKFRKERQEDERDEELQILLLLS